ncbi:MAG: glycosyltransferase family 39 protein [Candidatus Solibacter sp.]
MQTDARSPIDLSANTVGVVQPNGEPRRIGQPGTRRFWSRPWFWGFAIALGFSGWGMRTVGAYNVIETDAARHAMNGVFLRDLIASGQFTNAVAYARNYYAHLPALSLPYHPPLFPLIEALFCALFGVSIFSVRLAVAVMVGVSALTLFGLILKTHRSAWIAAFSTITFFCLPESLWLSADVMLEFPTLAFTLLALYCLQAVDREFSVRRALCFGVLAGAAVWAKQFAVFLGAVPFLYLIIRRRWRLFLKPGIWVSAGVFGAIVAALIALSIPVHGAGVNQAIPAAPIPLYLAYFRLFLRNVAFYATHYREVAGMVGLILLALPPLAVAVTFWRKGRDVSAEPDRDGGSPTFWDESVVYLAWTITSLGVLFLLRPYATRYLFLTHPAIIVLGFGSLFRLAQRLPGGKQTARAAALLLTAFAALQFPLRTAFLHGPEDVARALAPARGVRILYCGGTDGAFVLNYRVAHAGLDSTIISGDKLPNTIFDSPAFEQFAHDYGVNYIVLEDAAGWRRPWRKLIDEPLPTMVLERRTQLVSSTSRWNGSLQVYRFTNPSPQPKSDLAMRMFMIGGTMDFKLSR